MTSSSAVPEHRRLSRLGATVAAVAVTVTVGVGQVFHAALPATPFELPFGNPDAVRVVAPEGWAFFTRSPRSSYVLSYGAGPEGAWRSLTVGSRAHPASRFGLDRRERAQGTEVAILIRQVPESDWTPCERAPTDCLTARPAGRTVVNRSTHHSLCGDIGLVVQEVLPWAWRDLPTTMPSRVARVVVAC
jgi:antimicrobial peptide system SdpA family protein